MTEKTIYTNPEENSQRLDKMLELLDKMISIVDNNIVNESKEKEKI
jgi:dsDNA-binding SOS-regulon protein